jgi:hypothetical protein
MVMHRSLRLAAGWLGACFRAHGFGLLVMFVVWTVPTAGTAASLCNGSEPQLLHAAVGEVPNVQIWREGDIAPPPTLAADFDAVNPGFGMLVAVAARFQSSIGERALLARFGAISRLLQIRYWSTTDHMWRPLVKAATAVTGELGDKPRDDFAAAEIDAGADLYLSQTDSRSNRPVIYRMRLVESDARHFVIETANVTSLTWWGLTIYKPGDLQSCYRVEQQSQGFWSFYSLTRIASDNHWFTKGHDASYVNRAVALYRHYAGIRTDQDPPPAP